MRCAWRREWLNSASTFIRFRGKLSTLNKWVQQHQYDDLMSGPHEDVEKENRRLRKEVRLLREEMSLDILGVQIANGSKNPDD